MVRKVTAERDHRRVAFSNALSEAVRNSDLTLEGIAAQLSNAGSKVSVATLSYWQNGQTLPTRGSSLQAVMLLEQILGLQQGHLTRHVVTRDGWMPEDVTPQSRFAELVAEMGMSLERRLRILGCQDRVVVGEDRRSAHQFVRQFARVEAELTQSTLLAVADEDGHPPVITAGEGCVVTDLRTDDALGLSVAVITFARQMRRGEQFWYDFEVDWSGSEELRDAHSRMFSHHTALASMDIVFEGEQPTHAWYDVSRADGQQTESDEVEVLDGRIQLVISDAAPGEHTLHWAW